MSEGLPETGTSASPMIDKRIASLADWRGATFTGIRLLIRSTDSDIAEESKWPGVPAWSHRGIVCTGETYKAVVKFTVFD